MPNTNQITDQTKDDLSKHKRAVLNDLIREQVMHALGTPADLIDVQVRKVWDDHYRVNVLVGPSLASVRLCNSYFVETDANGSYIKTTPKIVKQY